MAKKTLPCPTLLRQLLRYEPETGKLFWLDRSPEEFKAEKYYKAWRTSCLGKPALNSADSYGYLTGFVNGTCVKAHRAIWAIVYGEWPPMHIDHINRNPQDNRIENLRMVTKQENAKNTKVRADNASGSHGVSWEKARRKWRAYIVVSGVQKWIGRFDKLEDAIKARQDAEDKYGFHINHGNGRLYNNPSA
jgi:hypothetical protein